MQDTKEKYKIALLVPMYNVLPSSSASAFFSTILGLNKLGHTVDMLNCDDTLIYDARNKLANLLTENKDRNYDYAIWIDSDQSQFDAKTIIRLIESYKNNTKFQILSATYFTKNDNNPRILGLKKKEFLYGFVDSYVKGEVIDVDVIGFGMCIMKPEILIKLYEKHNDKLFCPKYVEKDYIKGEDVVFCEYAAASGYLIGIDTSITIGHGFSTMTEYVYNSVREKNARTIENIKK